MSFKSLFIGRVRGKADEMTRSRFHNVDAHLLLKLANALIARTADGRIALMTIPQSSALANANIAPPN
jgi:hypothetical protein